MAAETCALALIERSKSFLDGNGQLRLALSELVHVLSKQLRYGEAMSTCRLILDPHLNPIPDVLSMYTREDIAELNQREGNLFMESSYLSEALAASLDVFGNEAPTHHIRDKLKVSLIAQGRTLELSLCE
jgi:hypothetical protein